MRAHARDHARALLLEAAVSIVQGSAIVDEVNYNVVDGARTTTKLTVVGLDHVDVRMSREEALEQLMEWCAFQIKTLRDSSRGSYALTQVLDK